MACAGRQRSGDDVHHHDGGERADDPDPRPHAGHPGAGGVGWVADTGEGLYGGAEGVAGAVCGGRDGGVPGEYCGEQGGVEGEELIEPAPTIG